MKQDSSIFYDGIINKQEIQLRFNGQISVVFMTTSTVCKSFAAFG